MKVMIFLALFNGLLVILARLANARLGTFISGTGASIWNHVVGFVVLTVIVLFMPGGRAPIWQLSDIPLYLFLGGLLGAAYVALNNWVIPHVGATRGTLLVVAGQMVVGTLIDIGRGAVSNIALTAIGLLLIGGGVWLGGQKKPLTINAAREDRERLENAPCLEGPL